MAIGVVLYAFLHVNQIGLPDLVKGPLLDQLRERGAELEFSRMRLRLGRGIVVEHVNLSRARGSAGEQVFADQLQLKLRWSDLLEFHVPAITAVTISGGKLAIPVVVDAGAAPFVFSATPSRRGSASRRRSCGSWRSSRGTATAALSAPRAR